MVRSSLAPGFRFHPTDEELVSYYLKRKVCGKSLHFDAISVVDVYKHEPWDLPSMSKLKTRDLEWYFFSALDRKYGNGSRTKRATDRGYWKTTGKDRPIHHNSRAVGMKKTLVYHSGRAPRGQRTNWVMHEYRLTNEELGKSGIAQDAFVLCRIFEKSGPGPKNGEKYGAPFIEEEWEDDNDDTYFPAEEAPVANDVAISDDAYLDLDDLDQSLNVAVGSEEAPLQQNFYYGESSKTFEIPGDVNEDNQKPIRGFEDGNGSFSGAKDKLDDLPGHQMDPLMAPNEYVNESNNFDLLDFDYLLDEPYFDAIGNPTNAEGFFLETNDLSGPTEGHTSNPTMVDPALFDTSDTSNPTMVDPALFDTSDGNVQNSVSYSSEAVGTENPTSDQASLAHKPVNVGTGQATMPSEHAWKAHEKAGPSSSKQVSGAQNSFSDMDGPFIKKACHMLGNIPAPPAFAAEFPSKDFVLLQNSASQPSSSIHFTAGMVRVTSWTVSGSEADWSATKNGADDVILTYGVPQGLSSASLLSLIDILSGKSGPSMSRGFWYLVFIGVLILSISFRVGKFISAL